MIRAVLLGCALFVAVHSLEDTAVSTDVAADETPSLMSLLRKKRDLYDNMYGNGMMMGMRRPMMGMGGMYPGMMGGMYPRRMMGMGYPGMMGMGMYPRRMMGMGY